jgi:hypothetical protein
MTQEIEIRVEDGVQVIRLLRADKKNALTGPMYDAMSTALDAAEKGDAVAAHVFIGWAGSIPPATTSMISCAAPATARRTWRPRRCSSSACPK